MRKLLITLLLGTISFHLNAQWTTVCNTGNGFVDNFENFNGDLYATGFFNTVCGTPCNYVAKYNGNTWQAVGNGFPHAGHHLKVIDSLLYGVAYQPNVDSNWVYKFDGTNFNKMGVGTYLTTAVSGFSQTNNLYNIVNYNNAVVVCGEFDRVGNKKISGIMKWTGTEWDSLGSGLAGNITGTAPVMYPHDLCVFGTDLIVAGNFKTAGGQLVNGIARWDGVQWHSLGQGFNSTVYGICVFNGELYAGGDFTMAGSLMLNYIAKWDGTNWVDPGFSLFYISPLNYSFIHTLKVLNNKLLIGGGFDRALVGMDTMHCHGVVAFDGITIDTLDGGVIGNEVEALATYNGLLFVGGGPNNSNSYVGSYNLLTSIHENSNLRNEIRLFPNPAKKQFTITGLIENTEVIVTDILGNKISEQQARQKELSVQIEKEGLYLIYISTPKGTVVKKIIIN